MAVDGLHFVMSRTSLLDGVLMFFVVAAFGCLVVDRDRARERLAAALPTGPDGRVRPDGRVADAFRFGWRPWRWGAGVMLGLAVGTKWSGLYVLAAFCVMTVLWDVGTRKVAGARHPYLAVLKYDTGAAFVATVPVALVVYVASWTGWITLPPPTARAATTATGRRPTARAARGRSCRTGCAACGTTSTRCTSSTSTSTSRTPTSPTRGAGSCWAARCRTSTSPPSPGSDGCPVDAGEKCAREVLAIGTPLLWWAACFAIGYVLWRWAFRRDWRAGAVACGIAAGWAPWFFYQERTIFLFYAVVFLPFLCLAVAMMIGAIVGPPRSSDTRRVIGATAAGVLVLLIAWNFIYFWPLYTGQAIPIDSWRSRMWLDTWV